MVTETKDVTAEWPASPTYTATEPVYVALAPTDAHEKRKEGSPILRFASTDSDVAPAIPVEKGFPMPLQKTQSLELEAGERLWVAGYPTSITFEVQAVAT